MTSVFLSYSRLDGGVVAPLSGLLRGVRLDVFRDEEAIVPGDEWHAVIVDAIHSCDTMLLFWSAAAADSKAVEEERLLASSLRKRIVPVLLDDTPLDPCLASYQWVDLREVVKGAALRSVAVAVTAAAPGASAVGWIPFLRSAVLAVAAYKLGLAFVGRKDVVVGFSEGEEEIIKSTLLQALRISLTSNYAER